MRKYAKGSATSLLVIGIVFLALVILGLFGYSVSKETAKKKAIEKDIAALKAQEENIKKENMALSERISYLSSKDYQEMQAKDKLNLQSPGENVVIIAPRNSAQNSVSQPAKNEAAEQSAAEPNFKKWLTYFFKP
ncbi:MAG: septum formation initiator family protein [Parcubacteria group bacterium]